MGSLDGAEICEIVGLYILNKLVQGNVGLTLASVGLYRDDGLTVTKIARGEKEKFKAGITRIFEREGLKITTSDHLTKSVDFLDATMHLNTGQHEPYRKDGPPPVYINRLSNHPPVIIRNLPSMIEKRVSGLCSSRVMFEKHAPFYNKALKNSGYKDDIKYIEHTEQRLPKKKRARYNTYWYNPPYNKAVTTKVGEKFLQLIDKHFPVGSKWNVHFNRKTIKVSYCCTRNMASHISESDFLKP